MSMKTTPTVSLLANNTGDIRPLVVGLLVDDVLGLLK